MRAGPPRLLVDRCGSQGGVQGEIVGTVGGAGRDVTAATALATGAQASPRGPPGEAILLGFQGAHGECLTQGGHLVAAVGWVLGAVAIRVALALGLLIPACQIVTGVAVLGAAVVIVRVIARCAT